MTDILSRRSALAQMGVAAALAAIPKSARAAGATKQLPLADLDIPALLRLAAVPSVAYVTVNGDQITASAAGVRKIGDPAPVSADSVYSAASITKTVSAYVYLGLVIDGALSLDRPIREYLELPNPEDPYAGKITARHLLSHSSGWRNWRFDKTDKLTAAFEPGTKWSYSGEGFFFLQRVAEKLTGKSMSQLAREQVFEPLGMTNTSFAALERLEPLQVTPHGSRGNPVSPFGRDALLALRAMMAAKGLPQDAARVEDSEAAFTSVDKNDPPLPNNLNPNAAASMLTSANDFGRLLRHLVNAPTAGGRAAKIVNYMMTPQVRCNEAIQWGLGVGLQDAAGTRHAWQWGDNTGFKNFYLADPANARGLGVFTNGDHGARVYERVIRSITGSDQPAFLWA